MLLPESPESAGRLVAVLCQGQVLFFQRDSFEFRPTHNPLRRWLKRFRDQAACLNRGGLAGMIARRFAQTRIEQRGDAG